MISLKEWEKKLKSVHSSPWSFRGAHCGAVFGRTDRTTERWSRAPGLWFMRRGGRCPLRWWWPFFAIVGMRMCERRRTRGFHATGIEPRCAFVVSAAKYVFHFDILTLLDVCAACQVATMKEHCKFAPLSALGQTDDTPHLRVMQELNYALARKNLPGFVW